MIDGNNRDHEEYRDNHLRSGEANSPRQVDHQQTQPLSRAGGHHQVSVLQSSQPTSDADYYPHHHPQGRMGTYLGDKLKNIRPFTEGQLLSLHAIDEVDCNDQFVNDFLQDCIKVQETDFYHKLSKVKKWKFLLDKTKTTIKDKTSIVDNSQDACWSLNNQAIVQKARCADGRLVELKHSYVEAVFKPESAKTLEAAFLSLQEILPSEFAVHYFMSQLAEKHVHQEIKEVVDMASGASMASQDVRQVVVSKLKQLISVIFAYVRCEDLKSDHFMSSKEWLTQLIQLLLKESDDLNDRLFILNHVLRCSGGISNWANGYVQFPSPLDASDTDTALANMNYCLAALHTILTPVKGRDKFLGIWSPSAPSTKDKFMPTMTSCESPELDHQAAKVTDDSWLLVDADTEESEEYFANRVNFTESDIISLIKQVPFVSVVTFLTEGSEQLLENGSHCTFGQFTEVAMLKLLAVTTRIVKILRQGLITFNCIQFKSLTEYVTCLIRVTVKSVSEFWSRCKNNITSDDQGLLLRLQVEYDHFILRSVTTILEAQRFGVWKFVSVIPFTGVTEAMMWHILWVFYNNGRDDTDDLGGLCPYVSDSYWKAKFDDPTVKFVFREKVPTYSDTECHCLLESLGNMVKTRDSREVDFITTVTNEMLELSFMVHLSSQMTRKCTSVFGQISRQHPFLLSSLIRRIKETNPRNESIIEAMWEMPTDDWYPTKEDLDTLTDWLINNPINHFNNRLARVLLTKVNWGVDRRHPTKLHMDVTVHRILAIGLYNAAKMHVLVEDSEDPFNASTFSGFDAKSTFILATSPKHKDFIEWNWRILLTLRLHHLEQPCPLPLLTDPMPSMAPNFPSITPERNGFPPPPNVDTDTSLLPVAKGLRMQNPFAIYITLSMTERGHRTDIAADILKDIITLLTGKNYLQTLSILEWFVPLNVDSADVFIKSSKFVSTFTNLLTCDQGDLLDRLLGLICRQFEGHVEIKADILTFWIDLLYEVATKVVKGGSSSWFVSSTKGLQQVAYLYDNLVQLTSQDEVLHNHFLEVMTNRPFNELFARLVNPQNGLMSWMSFHRDSTIKKSEWLTPNHVLVQKYPDNIWLSWIVVKGDVVKMEEVWQEILSDLNANFESPPDVVVKNICACHNLPIIPMDLLPINSWARLVVDTPADHPLLPLITFDFFKSFFSSTPTGGSFGPKFLSDSIIQSLKAKITQMADYHHREWSMSTDKLVMTHHSTNTKVYRAFLNWLEEAHLHDPFVDFTRLPGHFCTDLLKQVMDGAPESVMSAFIDQTSSVNHKDRLLKLWAEVKSFNPDIPSLNPVVGQSSDELSDVVQSVPESKVSNMDAFAASDEEAIPGSGPVISSFLQHNIRSVMEEGRFFETRLDTLSELNRQFTSILPERYQNVQKEIVLKGTCASDLSGCLGAAAVSVSISEATKNPTVKKELERKRIEGRKILLELMETPSDKIVSSVVMTETYINRLSRSRHEEDEKVLGDLMAYLLSWIREKESVHYPPTKYLFNSFLETLKMDSQDDRDRTCLFLLQTAISHPHLVEYFAPRLVPSTCSPTVFLKMYQVMQDKSFILPPSVTFVLLSKFDVAAWFKKVPEDLILKFHQILGAAIYGLGLNPAPEHLMTLGLYRKHLQYSLIFQFPAYLNQVMTLLFRGMSQFNMYPILWNDVLLSFGLYLKPGLSLPEVLTEVKKYARHQPLLSTTDLFNLLKLVSRHFSDVKKAHPRTEVVPFFKDYLQDYSLVLTAISIMWINVSARSKYGQVLDLQDVNIENVWRPLLEAWSPWIYPLDLNRLGPNDGLDRVWMLFTETILFFNACFVGVSPILLSLVWESWTGYLSESGCLDCANLSLIQSELKRLDWSRFQPSEMDANLVHWKNLIQ